MSICTPLPPPDHNRSSSDACRAKLLADRDALVARLRESSDEVPVETLSRDLGWKPSRVGMVAGAFPRYFGRWKDDAGRDRRTFIDLHTHLRLSRTA